MKKRLAAFLLVFAVLLTGLFIFGNRKATVDTKLESGETDFFEDAEEETDDFEKESLKKDEKVERTEKTEEDGEESEEEPEEETEELEKVEESEKEQEELEVEESFEEESEDESQEELQTEKLEKKTVRLSINVFSLLEDSEKLDESKRELVPEDGIIFEGEVEFTEGETVFDILKRVTKENAIHLESTFTPVYNSAYIEGINNLYEFDAGSESGWTFSVNGVFPNYGVSLYEAQNGDQIVFAYTTTLGRAEKGDE